MLYEIKNISQYENEPHRRWFFDMEIDLAVWFDEKGGIESFQLCYGKPKNPHALTWRKEKGFLHHAVDDGEEKIGRKGIPILLSDGMVDRSKIVEIFRRKSRNMDPDLSKFVHTKLLML